MTKFWYVFLDLGIIVSLDGRLGIGRFGVLDDDL